MTRIDVLAADAMVWMAANGVTVALAGLVLLACLATWLRAPSRRLKRENRQLRANAVSAMELAAAAHHHAVQLAGTVEQMSQQVRRAVDVLTCAEMEVRTEWEEQP